MERNDPHALALQYQGDPTPSSSPACCLHSPTSSLPTLPTYLGSAPRRRQTATAPTSNQASKPKINRDRDRRTENDEKERRPTNYRISEPNNCTNNDDDDGGDDDDDDKTWNKQ
ncbi:uncharacterized protein K452DRAFT_311693 [Aplosporella prunicola CBS 121167]|uniref:Uncharacterized protein n=1 Tax=Aplosporella prunicola CBS 121167 TaxID=1176127 RepID=A0A6A6B2R7_9PEZI|nr:uncharacterized protein K452DRAFT_311693 [Aplosporella prunicola CBS 121167]KAF2138340.1 hypothetical protein K452DRAFT_311693 [Aplosporella prunicola CBS 121167]